MPRFPGIFPSSRFAVLRGQQDIDPVQNPAAASEWLFTIPGPYYRRLISAHATFTTSATVANRFAGVRITDSQNTLFTCRPSVALAASTAVDVDISPQFTTVGGGANGVNYFIPIPDAWLPPGYTIGSTTAGLSAADQYSAVVLWWEMVDQSELQEHYNHEMHRGATSQPGPIGRYT